MEEVETPIVIHNNENIEKMLEKRLIKREEVNLLFFNKDTWLNNETFIETIDDIDEDYAKNEEKQKEFWKIIEKLIEIYKKDDYDSFDFSDIKFPSMTYRNIKIPSKIFSNLGKEIIFDNTTFVFDADFSGMFFTDGVSFYKTKFMDEVIFGEVKFSKKTTFNETYFKGKADFSNSKFENLEFLEVEFNSSSIFKAVSFDGLVKFSLTEFNKEASFENAHFFKNISFDKLNFEKKISLDNAIVDKELSIRDITATTLNLNEISFHKLLLRNIEVDNFHTLHLYGRKKFEKTSLKKNHFQDKETARIIKASFEKNNNITESNRYFVFEQELYLNEAKGTTVIPLYINKFVSNFGTDWFRALLLLILLSYLFMVGYVACDNHLKGDDIEHFTNPEDIRYIWGMLSVWILFYISTFYQSRKNIFNTLIGLGVFIGLVFFNMYDKVLLIQDYIIQLMNPINAFKSINLYTGIEIYGTLIRIVVVTITYQFVVAFRQNTRRK